MKQLHKLITLALLCTTAPRTLAQSINIDIGCGPLSTPSDSGGGVAGQWGSWNLVDHAPAGAALVDLNGAATSVLVSVSNVGGHSCADVPNLGANDMGAVFDDFAAVGPGATSTWTLSGLVALRSYTITLSCWDPASPGVALTSVRLPLSASAIDCGQWDGSGFASPQSATVVADVAADANGEIRWSIAPAVTSPRGALNAIQISDRLAGSTLPETYCTAGVNIDGCVGQISTSGTPSTSAGSGFEVRVTGARRPSSRAIFIYSVNGRLAQSFCPVTNSFICIRPPHIRFGGTVILNGAPCTGTFAADWNQLAGWSVMPGDVITAQGWWRDGNFLCTGVGINSLSDAVEFTAGP